MRSRAIVCMTLICTVILFSCEDKRNTPPFWMDEGGGDWVGWDENYTFHMTTYENDDLNYWTSEMGISYHTKNPNDFTSWNLYTTDGGGWLEQNVDNDVNHWSGILNSKGTTDSLRLDAVEDGNFNEWVSQTKTQYTLYKYRIKTVTVDDFNYFKVYDFNTNAYQFGLKTTNNNDYNSWTSEDFKYTFFPDLMVCFMPALFTVVQPQ